MPSAESKTFDRPLQLARQALYRFAGLALLDPRAGAWEHLASVRQDPLVDEAAQLVRQRAAAEPMQLAPDELPLESLAPAAVLQHLPDKAEGLEQQYLRVFGLVVMCPSPPYETEYIDSRFAYQRSQTLADIAGFYRAFGLAPSSQHRQRQDHIVLELELMALLVDLQRRATDQGSEAGSEQAEICLQAQRRFLAEHLGWWAPRFARLLTKEDPTGFYGAAGRFLAAWIAADRQLLGVRPSRAAADPCTGPPPGECEGCMSSEAVG